MQPFDDDVVRSIADYMNENQPDVNLLIVQVHGGVRSAMAASLVDLGGESATFAVQGDGDTETVVIPWPRPISRREHIRRELMELYETALES
jgi:hypothetical protein